MVLLPCRVRLVFAWWLSGVSGEVSRRAAAACLVPAGVLAEVLARVLLPVRGIGGLV
jgi:hypothetical protein